MTTPGPTGTAVQEAVPDDRPAGGAAGPSRRNGRRARIGITLVGLGILLALAALGVVTVLGTAGLQQRDQAAGERDDAAEEARKVSVPALALCSRGGDVAPILEATGLCDAAGQALDNPVVAANTAPLTPAEIDIIVARVLPATLPGAPLVPGVLDRLADDEAAPGLDEAATRAIVAAAMDRAQQAEQQQAAQGGQPGTVTPAPEQTGEPPATGQPEPPASTAPAEPEPPAEQMTGLRFERDPDGQCRGITTFTREDGTTREEVSAAPDGACGTPAGPGQTGEPSASSEPPAPSETPQEPVPTDEPGITLLPPP